MRFAPRPFVTFVVLVSLLFAQLAVAAYPCPGAESMSVAAFAAAEAPDCHQSPDPRRDPLCLAHCQQADQSRDTPSVSLPAVAPASGLSPGVVQPDDPGARARFAGFHLDRRLEPPATLRHCRLHI